MMWRRQLGHSNCRWNHGFTHWLQTEKYARGGEYACWLLEAGVLEAGVLEAGVLEACAQHTARKGSSTQTQKA